MRNTLRAAIAALACASGAAQPARADTIAPTVLGQGVPGGRQVALAIDASWIVGSSGGSAVVWSAADPTAAPSPLPGGLQARAIYGNEVAGYGNGRALVWDAAHPSNAPIQLAGTNATAEGIEQNHVVGTVGSAAAVWDLDAPAAAPRLLNSSGYTFGIAEKLYGDTIVGYVEDANGYDYAAIWSLSSPGAAPTILGGIDRPITDTSAYTYTYGNDLNASWIVADAYRTDGSHETGLVWSAANPTGQPVELGGGYAYADPYALSGNLIVGYAGDEANDFWGAVWDATHPTAAPILLGPVTSDTSALGVYGRSVVGVDTTEALLWTVPAPSGPSIPEPGSIALALLGLAGLTSTPAAAAAAPAAPRARRAA
jgi:hypothetical protein